jgi:hypothetical protein
MRVIQARQYIPLAGVMSDAPGILDYVTRTVTSAFYDEVEKILKVTPGGILLGQPKISVKTGPDFLSNMGDMTTVSMTASCEELPLPPEYRFIGGPADGYNIPTRGERIWLVPQAPPTMGAYSYAGEDAPIPRLVAEYERQGDTGVYFYKRTYES